MSEPIAKWEFDPKGNLTIHVATDNVAAFADWINDEYGDSEDEMYALQDACANVVEAFSKNETWKSV